MQTVFHKFSGDIHSAVDIGDHIHRQWNRLQIAAFSSFSYMGSFFHGYDIVGSESGLWDGGYHSNQPHCSGYYSNAINHIRDIDTYYLRASDWLLQAD